MLAEEKEEISEGIWDLDQAGNGKGGTVLAANPDSLLRRGLLLAAVPPLEWEAARDDPQQRSQPATAFSSFSSPQPQPVDHQSKRDGGSITSCTCR